MQHRDKLILEFWDRSNELTLKNKKYKNFVKKFFYFLLKEDIAKKDITTKSLIGKNKKIFAEIVAREDGIFAGLEEFAFLNRDLKIKSLKKDSDKIRNGDILIEINGNAQKIIERERTSLNLLQRMSGIATLTNTLVRGLGNKAKLAATRKTLWGNLDKKAVSIGGGLTHRLNLNDGVIIKDNHLKLMSYDIEKALKLAKNKSKYIEIEVENREQALSAAQLIKKISSRHASELVAHSLTTHGRNFFAIMLDKIPPNEIKSIVKELKNLDLYDYALLEASGNVAPNNLGQYADCGIDVISMGCITNSAKALDMSQEIK